MCLLYCTLHSTMSLLKHAMVTVYIYLLITLHSTMSLLKPVGGQIAFDYSVTFTFHYVSIKTPYSNHPLVCPNLLYIPLCLY